MIKKTQTRPRFRKSRKVIDIVNIRGNSKLRLNQTFVAEETKGDNISIRSRVDTALVGEVEKIEDDEKVLDKSKFSADDVSAYGASV